MCQFSKIRALRPFQWGLWMALLLSFIVIAHAFWILEWDEDTFQDVDEAKGYKIVQRQPYFSQFVVFSGTERNKTHE